MGKTWTRGQAEHLYRRYVGLVRYRALRILGDEQDAHEVTQEAFARLLKHYDPADAEDTPAALLIRITTNLSLNLIRNNTARREKLRQRGADELPPANLLDHETIERSDLIRTMLGQVPPDVAALAVNFYLDGMSKREIAELHHLSVPTVRKRLNLFVNRSRKKLAKDLMTAVTLVLAAALMVSRQ